MSTVGHCRNLAIGLSLLVLGCGGEPVARDVDLITGLASSIGDASRDAKTFQALFVPGAAPNDAQRQRYARYSFEVKSPKSSGDTATATVVVRDPRTGQVLGEQQWSAEKVDGAWKLKSAPLPEAGKP